MPDPSQLPDTPFKGPFPIEEGDSIFGRSREIDSIYNLICSNRIVVLHSPSGAGKTSLVQAGLIPRLSTRFSVWGPMLVGLEPAEDSTANRFSSSVIYGLESDSNSDVESLSLLEYAASRRHPDYPVVFIFDQFEEILTADHLNRQAISEFFDQLSELFQEPSFFALFVIREDFLSALDPYRDRVPTQLNNRFRLNFLSLDAASEAIAKPAAAAGRPFTPPALDKLIKELATIPVQLVDGTTEFVIGDTIEPVHLQLACDELWSELPPDSHGIELADVEKAGDVSIALARYFDWSVAGIANDDPNLEANLRDWIADHLITQNGLRSQVLLTPNLTEGLPNSIVDDLVEDRLVRRENRAGSIWYELSHARFAHAVTISNELFFEQLHPFARAVRTWIRNEEDPSFLLAGNEFTSATTGLDLTKFDPDSNRFFNACLDLEQDNKQREAAQLSLQRYAASLTIAAGAITAIALWAIVFVLSGQFSRQYFLLGLALAALLGAAVAWLGRRFYLRQSETNRILHALTRKHRDDPSLQPGDYSITGSIPIEPGPIDLWEETTLKFVPYWILLTVAGADRRFTARELRTHNDINDIDAFIDDDRSAAEGLLDVAQILNTKMDPAKAAAFRAGMNKLARAIDRNPSEVKDSLRFVEVALEGGDISNLRPSITRFYNASGLFSWPKFFLALFLVAVGTFCLNYPYAQIHKQLHWTLNLGLAFIYGCLIMIAIYFAHTETKLRNRIAICCLALGATVVFYLNSPSIPELLLFAIPSVLIFTLASDDVFCERCNLWAESNDNFLTLKTPPEATLVKLRESLEAGNLTPLQSWIAPTEYASTSKDYLTIDIKSCPKCQDFQTLNLNQTIDGSVNLLVENLLISSKQLFWLKSQQPTSNT